MVMYLGYCIICKGALHQASCPSLDNEPRRLAEKDTKGECEFTVVILTVEFITHLR